MFAHHRIYYSRNFVKALNWWAHVLALPIYYSRNFVKALNSSTIKFYVNIYYSRNFVKALNLFAYSILRAYLLQ